MSSSSPQRLLFLDTSGPAGTVALVVDGELVSTRTSEQARDHAAVINNAIAEALLDGGVRMPDLTGICVMAGPGSYTGLRIGLSTAKGLCYALEVPLYLQNNLEVLATDARISSPNYRAYLVLLPARSGEYFLAAYGPEGGVLLAARHVIKEELLTMLANLPAETIICGSREVADEVCLMRPFPYVGGVDALKAWIGVSLGQVVRGESASPAEAMPFYLKAAFTTTPKNKT